METRSLSFTKVKGDITEDIIDSITQLDGWITANGWAGYDPYDIKGHPWVLKLICNQNQTRVLRLTEGGLLLTLEVSPQASRNLLRIKKRINAKAMGLFASAYLILYQQLKNDSYLQKTCECLKWLEENKSHGYAGACWGYPFDWQSVVFIPKRTPSAVVSSICGDAFWDFYKFTGDKKYLAVCQSICEFFINNLNVDYIEDNRLCFSYTPIDRFHIHNANLFAAAFLIKVGKELDREDLYQHGIKALNYTLNAQNEDGSFYYWALSEKEAYDIPDATLKTIDHYHTGFVLRSLYSIYKSTEDKRVLKALLLRGYQFYRDNLFGDEAVPRLKPESTYPINIHSCAEAILCMSTLSDTFPDALEYAQDAFLWTKENMQDKDGHFYYIKTKTRVNKMPYVRWGQAWMMRALAQFLEVRKEGLQN